MHSGPFGCSSQPLLCHAELKGLSSRAKSRDLVRLFALPLLCLYPTPAYDAPTMAKIDPEQERHRLHAYYSRLTDGELEQLSEDASDLTEIARQSLAQEKLRRGLVSANIQSSESGQSAEQPEFRRLQTIRQFRDLPEALLAKGCLESAGIEAFLADDNMVRLDWFMSNFIGGIKLKVKPEDFTAAIAIFEQPIPENFEVEGVGKYQQPCCPKCQSRDINFAELNKKVAYGSAYLGLPIPLHREAWKCHACGHEWKDPNSSTLT